MPLKLSGHRIAAGRAPGARERIAPVGGQGDGDIALSFDVKGRRVTHGDWKIENPHGSLRVLVTRELPGERWLQLLLSAGCRVEVAQSPYIPDEAGLRVAIGERCDAVIGQLTESWSAALLGRLAAVGGAVYSQYAVGYDNVDVAAATRAGLPVGNTPGVLTETTAQLAVALTFSAARRIAEGDRLTRAGAFEDWSPTMLLGSLIYRRTVGVVGAGRIGAAYARMMVEGHKMDLVYLDPRRNERLESSVAEYAGLLVARGEKPVTCRRARTLQELLAAADVISLHASLDETTRHLIGAPELAAMKEGAILVNSSRGTLVDEAALVEHCRTHSGFRAGLDVYENEPAMTPGLAELDNVVLLPHLGSATVWTREGMATLAAANVTGILNGWPVWPPITGLEDVRPFLEGASPPRATPSIVNAADLGLPVFATQAANKEERQ